MFEILLTSIYMITEVHISYRCVKLTSENIHYLE